MVRNLSRVLLFTLSFAPVAPAQEKAATPAPAQIALSYPDSPDGLRQMLQELFAAMRQKDGAKLEAFRKNMILPDYANWFVRAFGEQDGPKLAALYAKEVAEWDSHLDDIFDPAARLKKRQIEVRRVEPAQKGPLHDVVVALKEPASFYAARIVDSRDLSAPRLGYYFYVSGNFRFVDAAVLSALSSIKPYRIPVGTNVAVATLIRQVNPVLPQDLKKMQGTVVVKIVIGVDGTVNNVMLVSGPPLLFPPAMEALRQWRFRPTLLDSWPVEVETTLSISFSRGG